jgi:hypothetical protein
MIKYNTTILTSGNNTGIEVPEDILAKLSGGKKPLVVVRLNNYTYRSAVAKMGDKYLISLSAENRKNANVKGGDTLTIELELDTAPRTVEIPDDLQKAFDRNKTAKANFDKLAPRSRRHWCYLLMTQKQKKPNFEELKKLWQASDNIKRPLAYFY